VNFNLLPLCILGLLLVPAVIAVAAYRKILSIHEDDALHVVEGSAAVSRQAALVRKLHVIDRWLQVTTIVMVIRLILIAAICFYQHWARLSAMQCDPWPLDRQLSAVPRRVQSSASAEVVYKHDVAGLYGLPDAKEDPPSVGGRRKHISADVLFQHGKLAYPLRRNVEGLNGRGRFCLAVDIENMVSRESPVAPSKLRKNLRFLSTFDRDAPDTGRTSSGALFCEIDEPPIL